MPDLQGGPRLQELLVEAVREGNVLPLTGQCNVNCIFCSHKSNPPSARAYSFPPVPEKQVTELIKFLNPARKIIIGESATLLREGEPLTHPSFIQILKLIRHTHPRTLIQITTNATLLDTEKVQELEALMPVEIIVSLNSATTSGRKIIMGLKQAGDTLDAVKLLCRFGIPYHGSIVALPHLVGFDDIKETVLYLDGKEALTVRLLLPGYTRFSSPELSCGDDMINRLPVYIEDLREQFAIPLIIEPPLVTDLDPIIEGVIRSSPADATGLQRGDRILAVDGIKPRSRVEAFNLIEKKANPAVKLSRDGKIADNIINKEAASSPGLVMNYDLNPVQVEQVKRIEGERKLALVSMPALKRWELAAEIFSLKNVDFKAVKSHYFGGSINCSGLLTVSDYQEALKNISHIKDYEKLLLPSIAFDRSGYDVSGMHYLELDSSGVPIKLVF